MRATTRIMQLAHARWTPCVALVLGSLLFVSLAIVVIPDRLGPIGPQARNPRTFTPQSAVANEPFQVDPASTVRMGSPSPASPPASPRLNGNNNALVGSLFGSTPPMELPVAPPDPAPPPPPAEVPPPAPTPSIYELPAPPPPPIAPAPTVEPAAAPAPGAPQPSEPEPNAAQGQQQQQP